MKTRSQLRTLSLTRPTVGLSLAPLRKAWPKVVAAFESPWVAYPLLFLLQLKMIWGVWALQDIRSGDTAYYFMEAWAWFTRGDINVAWSPLYTTFYGSFLFINSDPVWATMAHRVVIVLTAALLVLAVLRQLLPASIAWVCAAWWATQSMMFNTLYEVHLFSAIPVLAAWLLLLTANGPWRRAMALGIFAASTIWVRNELCVPAFVLGAVLAGYEWRRLRRGEGATTRATVFAYATCLAIAGTLCVTAYQGSRVKGPELSRYMNEKHTVNMAQVYAFGYQQRHPEWTGSPWLDCEGLMQQTFGQPRPTLREMIAANPGAVTEHFAWNVSLTPNGLQLLLFGRVFGSLTPDYDLSQLGRMNQRRAGVLGVAFLAVWVVGFVLLWRGRRDWWQNWLSARSLGWAAMFAVASVVPLIILTQRPRPSYLFTFAVLLIAITGICLQVIATRWRLTEVLRGVVPLFMVGVVLLVPRHFTQANASPRGTAKGVERLLPYRAAIMAPRTVTVVPDVYGLGLYIHPRCHPTGGKSIQAFGELVSQLRPDESFAALLERHRVKFLYLEEQSLAWLEQAKCEDAADFVNGRGAARWELLAAGNIAKDRWRIYRRVK